jgi:hypothetical protein
MNNTISKIELAASPALSVEEFAQLISLPLSTLEEVFKSHQPPLFLLGRRKYLLREDALQWLQEMSLRTAYTPRRNRRAAR